MLVWAILSLDTRFNNSLKFRLLTFPPQCSPGLYGLMTRYLASLARGRLVMALEGGYNLDTLSEAGKTCAEALLGHVDTPTRVIANIESAVDREAVESVRNVIRAQKKYWKCFQD